MQIIAPSRGGSLNGFMRQQRESSSSYSSYETKKLCPTRWFLCFTDVINVSIKLHFWVLTCRVMTFGVVGLSTGCRIWTYILFVQADPLCVCLRDTYFKDCLVVTGSPASFKDDANTKQSSLSKKLATFSIRTFIRASDNHTSCLHGDLLGEQNP